MRSQGKKSWWEYCLRVLRTKKEEKDEDEDGEHVAQGHKAKELVKVLPKGARYKRWGWGWGWWSCWTRSQGKRTGESTASMCEVQRRRMGGGGGGGWSCPSVMHWKVLCALCLWLRGYSMQGRGKEGGEYLQQWLSCSSEWSPQSLSPSQAQVFGMQRLLEQVNWSAVQDR